MKHSDTETWLEKLTRWANDLDEYLRFRDLAAGRTAGGWLDRRFGIRRHTRQALVLPAAVCFFAILATPNFPRLAWAIAAALAMFLWLANRMAVFSGSGKSLRHDLNLQVAAVSLVAILIAIFGGREYSDSFPYRNMLLPLTLAVALVLFAAGFLAEALFQGLRPASNFSESLRRAELFAARGPILPVTAAGLLTAFVMVPFRAPLELLIPPAIAALLASPAWLNLTVFLAFAVCLIALVASGLNERFGMMWSLLNHALLQGGAQLVSLAVLALATGRFLGVSYVTTIFDTAAGHAILTVLTSAYVLSWWFSYWMNRLLSDQLIRIVDPGRASGEVSLRYSIEENAVATKVPADGRVLQLHGSSRFIAIRDRRRRGEITFFQAYPALDLPGLLAVAGAPGGRAVPTVLQIKGRAFTFHSLTAALLAVILIAVGWAIHGGIQDAELVTEPGKSGGGIPLASLLAKPADDHTLLVVAASGGGTRAALFTAAILEGIASRGKAADIVLGSGVSGGGAALAYFSGFRPALTAYDGEAWEEYYKAMKAPYIRDVLERASEWRMVREGRLGMLLRESFSRRWGLPESESALDRCPSGPRCGFGLILNTTLAGHLHLRTKAPDGKTLAEVEPDHRRETNSSVAGGRLLLTNLALDSGFAGTGIEPEDHGLPVVIRGPGAHLQHGAALNANFPPVFANAAIDMDKQDRYWVTDGGAADNRGAEMLLYAIRNSLRDAAKDQLPKIHIIVADASAYSGDYVQDRGVSSALGAGAHFASALDAELRSSIENLYGMKPGDSMKPGDHRFRLSYIYMPRPLRASGSFGTHWMLQSSITVRQKHEPVTMKDRLEDWFLFWIQREPNPQLTITGEEMIHVLRSLYARKPVAGLDLAPKACQVLKWAREETSGERSRAEWIEVMKALGDEDPDLAPSCR